VNRLRLFRKFEYEEFQEFCVRIYPGANLPCRVPLAVGGGFVLAAPICGGAQEWNPQRVGEPLLRDPIWVYNIGRLTMNYRTAFH